MAPLDLTTIIVLVASALVALAIFVGTAALAWPKLKRAWKVIVKGERWGGW